MQGFADKMRALGQISSYSVVSKSLANEVAVGVDEVVAQFVNTLYTRVECADRVIQCAFLRWR